MTPTIIISIIAGLLAYWFTKMPAEIKGVSPITNLKDFFAEYWQKIIISCIGAFLLILNGPDMNFDLGTAQINMGKIDGIIPAFIAGGAIPSMMNNIMAAIKKKGEQ